MLNGLFLYNYFALHEYEESVSKKAYILWLIGDNEKVNSTVNSNCI